MTTFLTVREASQKTGRSTSYIRRIIYPILEQDGHLDRGHIKPSPDDVHELRMKGQIVAWSVSEEFLEREISARSKPGDDANDRAPGSREEQPAMGELLLLLREQLKLSQEQLTVKDQQIANLSELMKSLNERLREGNILIGSLQKQLTPPSESVKDASVVSPQKPVAKPSPQGTKASPKKEQTKPPKPSPKKTARRGFLARLFS